MSFDWKYLYDDNGIKVEDPEEILKYFCQHSKELEDCPKARSVIYHTIFNMLKSKNVKYSSKVCYFDNEEYTYTSGSGDLKITQKEGKYNGSYKKSDEIQDKEYGSFISAIRDFGLIQDDDILNKMEVSIRLPDNISIEDINSIAVV